MASKMQVDGLRSPAGGGVEGVFLHLYDLSDGFARINSVALDMGFAGLMHVGVEVFGHEWSFGMHGVCVSVPRQHQYYTFRQSVAMGTTRLQQRDVVRAILKLRAEWPGSKYDLLTKNCGTFCNELCMQLGVGGIPAWVTRLAEAVAKLPAARTLAVALTRASVAPDAAAQWESMELAYQALAQSSDSRECATPTPRSTGSERGPLVDSPLQVRFSGSPGPGRQLPSRRCEAFRVDEREDNPPPAKAASCRLGCDADKYGRRALPHHILEAAASGGG